METALQHLQLTVTDVVANQSEHFVNLAKNELSHDKLKAKKRICPLLCGTS